MLIRVMSEAMDKGAPAPLHSRAQPLTVCAATGMVRFMAESESTGIVASLHVTDGMSRPMRSLEVIEALAGQGVKGDRYMLGAGTYSKKPEPGRQITLIEAETLKWLRREHGIEVMPEECRRNVVTRGIRLVPLVGRDLMVGEVRLHAHRINQPCKYLENLLKRPGLYEAMWDRGGINCEILTGGTIRVGDLLNAISERNTGDVVPMRKDGGAE